MTWFILLSYLPRIITSYHFSIEKFYKDYFARVLKVPDLYVSMMIRAVKKMLVQCHTCRCLKLWNNPMAAKVRPTLLQRRFMHFHLTLKNHMSGVEESGGGKSHVMVRRFSLQSHIFFWRVIYPRQLV